MAVSSILAHPSAVTASLPKGRRAGSKRGSCEANDAGTRRVLADDPCEPSHADDESPKRRNRKKSGGRSTADTDVLGADDSIVSKTLCRLHHKRSKSKPLLILAVPGRVPAIDDGWSVANKFRISFISFLPRAPVLALFDRGCRRNSSSAPLSAGIVLVMAAPKSAVEATGHGTFRVANSVQARFLLRLTG